MPTVIPVRMHFNAQDLWFLPGRSQAKAGDHVIVPTERGTEFGLATADPFSVPDSELKGKSDLRPVVRIATDKDIERAEDLAAQGEQAMPIFRKLVKESGLDIKPVGVEFLFGGEKVVFYFAAEDRVDFRDLVRELAGEFHQRVDMRQIGVRDEARLAGGYAPCGQELCCVRFGGQFQPVSIRMAIEQDLPLNSSKISGVCGRLMCCLRYEFDAYRDFKQRAPKKNNLIDTPLGKAKIVEYNTPKETLLLRLENGKSFTIALKDMTCSEGCCKRSKEQNIPLRPDTVTREALEALGTAEIAMQLAELDRANGEGDGYSLDMSLLDSQRTPRKRKTDKVEPAAQATPARKPRRQSKPAPAAEEDNVQGNDTAQTPKEEQKRGPRGGGMRPRRTQKTSPDAKRTASATRDAKNPADDTAKPRRQANAAKQAGTKSGKAAEAATEPQKRTRRHHSAATPTQHGQHGQQGQAVEQTQVKNAQRQGAPQESNRTGEQKPRRRTAPSPEAGSKQQRPQAERRRHTKPAQDKPSGAEGSTPSTSQAPTRRRRRPGDKGGSNEQ